MMDNDRFAQQLLDGLTSEQIVELVARLLDEMSDTERTEFCDLLDLDVATVFRRLLEPPATATADETSEMTSDARFAQQFGATLAALEGLLIDLGDEYGDYIYQEHHWEAPDFDASRLASDIEDHAQDLLPLLDRAAELELEDKDWFLGLCREITDGIESYPEYIYTEEGVCLEHTATECVLKWLDLHAGSEASFLDELVVFMAEAGHVSLDNGTIRTYLLEGWVDGRRRAMYHAVQIRRLSDSEFERETDNPHALWHKIRYALAGEFDIAGRIEIAEASVAEDWSKGVGLVDAALAEGNSARALEFCHKTVDAYFHRRSSGRDCGGFDPGTTPLFDHWGMADELPTVSRILLLWAKLATGDGDIVLAEHLAIQEALFTRADDWTAIRHVFNQAVSADTAILFSAWKNQTLKGQCSSTYLGGPPLDPVWPEWLIDAGFANRFEAFAEKAVPWLEEKIESGELPVDNVFAWHRVFAWPPQLSLVADLFAREPAPGQYPTLKAMLAQYCKLSACPARLEWLGNTDVAGLTSAAVVFVSRNMVRLISSPGSMSGNYESAADWLAVAREVAPETARDTLRHWQGEYKRRRNLWRDLRGHGFDV